MSFPKPILGLLGGPGSGKSFVARLFADAGCGVIDADRLAREALQGEGAKAALLAWWGDRVFTDDGDVDRAAVGSIVFERPDELKRLEGLIHPRVHEGRAALREAYAEDPDIVAIVEDCPLLIETGLDAECDRLIFVEASRETRLARVKEHRGWDADELDRREARQASLDTKRARADDVVNNDADADTARRDVRRVLSETLSTP